MSETGPWLVIMMLLCGTAHAGPFSYMAAASAEDEARKANKGIASLNERIDQVMARLTKIEERLEKTLTK